MKKKTGNVKYQLHSYTSEIQLENQSLSQWVLSHGYHNLGDLQGSHARRQELPQTDPHIYARAIQTLNRTDKLSVGLTDMPTAEGSQDPLGNGLSEEPHCQCCDSTSRQRAEPQQTPSHVVALYCGKGHICHNQGHKWLSTNSDHYYPLPLDENPNRKFRLKLQDEISANKDSSSKAKRCHKEGSSQASQEALGKNKNFATSNAETFTK